MANIQDVRSINNIQKSYMWEVEIRALSLGALPDLATYAKTVSIPQSAVEQIVINHKAGKVHHAGRDSAAHTMSITFWDDETGTIRKYMQNWMHLMHNPVTASGSPRDVYSAALIIKLKDSTDTTTTGTITLGHTFPIDMSDISLSYDSSEPIEVSVIFSYDEKAVA